MKLIRGKLHLGPGYAWMRTAQSPHKMATAYTDIGTIMCCVGGTRALITDNCIWGTLPGKQGVLTYFEHSDGIYELARLTDGIHYYWDRKATARSQQLQTPEMPSTLLKVRASPDEPWHRWSEETIARNIIHVCESFAQSDDLPSACLAQGLSPWGFDALFKSRYPYEYSKWKKNKEIPEISNLSETLVRRFPALSGFGG